MPIGYNPDVINPGGIDYAEVDNLINPPNPANAGKTIVFDENGKPTLGEGGGGGGGETAYLSYTSIGGTRSNFECSMSYDEISQILIDGGQVLVSCRYFTPDGRYDEMCAYALYSEYYDIVNVIGVMNHFTYANFQLTSANSWSVVTRTIPSST